MEHGNPLDTKLQHIANLIDAGQHREARRLLREVLLADSKDLAAWELLWRVIQSTKEELICLKHILAIHPNHAAARRRIDEIRLSSAEQNQSGPVFRTAPFIIEPANPPTESRPPSARRKKNQSNPAILLLLLLLPTICAGIFVFALFRGGYLNSIFFTSQLTATAVAARQASCSTLIEKAMQVSGSSCDRMGSNKACYGNYTIRADLAPDALGKFSQRGDIVDVDKVRRISASPLSVDTNDWGIAVFKVIANLPRSLPGQTVTMIVFGNTTLDNTGGGLQSFFFSNELGQIVCDQVPHDGIMITVPHGSGIHFTVNGADVTLMGDASLSASKNGKMGVSLFTGSGHIVAAGQEQYFGAGQEVNVPLSGDNGEQASGPPSVPQPISQDDYTVACTLTGQYCAPSQITPVSSDQAQQQILNGLGITATPTPTRTPSATITSTVTVTPTPSATGTPTILVIPSHTPSQTHAPIHTSTRTRTPTKGPSRTPSRTPKPAATSAFTSTPSSTFTTTNTPTVTPTATQSNTPTLTPTPTRTNTPTDTPLAVVPTATTDPWTDPACGGQVTTSTPIDSGNVLSLDLTNNTGGTITIDAMSIDWNVATANRLLEQVLAGLQIGNSNDSASPSAFPSPDPFTGPVARRRINAAGTSTLTLRFQNPPTGSGYTVSVHFDIGCQVSASK